MIILVQCQDIAVSIGVFLSYGLEIKILILISISTKTLKVFLVYERKHFSNIISIKDCIYFSISRTNSSLKLTNRLIIWQRRCYTTVYYNILWLYCHLSRLNQIQSSLFEEAQYYGYLKFIPLKCYILHQNICGELNILYLITVLFIQ